MALSITYPFDDANDYISPVTVSINGTAQLILVDDTGLEFEEDFDSDVGFTYDSDKAEFSGGQVQQKDTRPIDATLYASFAYDEDSDWGGNLNNTLVGGANWHATYGINLTGRNGKQLNMPANTGNFNTVGSVGCIRFVFKPDYSGGAPLPINILEFDSATGNNNAIFIQHYGTSLSVDLRDSVGSAHWFHATWSPTLLRSYVMELNFDFTPVTGRSRLFIDGIQVSSLNTSGLTRVAQNGTFMWGGNGGNADYFLDEVILFSAVQHTSSHAGELPYSYEQTIYVESKVELPIFTYSGGGSVQAFTDLTTSETNAPRYIMNDLYWTGAAWAASSGSFAKANIVADIVANIATLPAADTLNVDIVFEASNSLQMAISNLLVDYTGQAFSTTDPRIVPVTTVLADQLISASAVHNPFSGSDNIKWLVKAGSVYYYWNGTAWVVSDETYAQTNTLAEINTNAADIDIDRGVRLTLAPYLHSGDGTTTPILDSVTISYSAHGTLPSSPNTCTVFGYVYNNDSPIQNITIQASLVSIGEYNEEIVMTQGIQETTTDEIGYWEIDLTENVSMQAGMGWKIKYLGSFASKIYRKIVPNETIKNILELEDL